MPPVSGGDRAPLRSLLPFDSLGKPIDVLGFEVLVRVGAREGDTGRAPSGGDGDFLRRFGEGPGSAFPLESSDLELGRDGGSSFRENEA